MFSTLQKGTLVYVLDKRGDEPQLKQGLLAEDAIKLAPNFNQPLQIGVMPEQQVKLTIKIGTTDTMELTNLPGSQNTFTYPDGKIMVTESHDAIQGIISGLKAQSDEVVNGYDRHLHLSDVYKNMLMDLNPEFRKNEERDRELTALKGDMNDLKGMLQQLLSLNKGNIGKKE